MSRSCKVNLDFTSTMSNKYSGKSFLARIYLNFKMTFYLQVQLRYEIVKHLQRRFNFLIELIVMSQLIFMNYLRSINTSICKKKFNCKARQKNSNWLFIGRHLAIANREKCMYPHEFVIKRSTTAALMLFASHHNRYKECFWVAVYHNGMWLSLEITCKKKKNP